MNDGDLSKCSPMAEGEWLGVDLRQTEHVDTVRVYLEQSDAGAFGKQRHMYELHYVQPKSSLLTSFQNVRSFVMQLYYIIIIIVQPECPVVGRRPQHAASTSACLVLSSARWFPSSSRLVRLSNVSPVFLWVFSFRMVPANRVRAP